MDGHLSGGTLELLHKPQAHVKHGVKTRAGWGEMGLCLHQCTGEPDLSRTLFVGWEDDGIRYVQHVNVILGVLTGFL